RSASTVIYTLSLHDALPIFERFFANQITTVLGAQFLQITEIIFGLPRLTQFVEGQNLGETGVDDARVIPRQAPIDHKIAFRVERSEEHTSELQSRSDLVCRL